MKWKKKYRIALIGIELKFTKKFNEIGLKHGVNRSQDP